MPEITHRRKAPKDTPDFFPTPPHATRALMEQEKFTGVILEPCCGEGDMSEVLKETNPVFSSDLYNRGYGAVRSVFDYHNPIDNVITNPPFNIASDIILHMMPLFKNKMAMFLRTAFLESVSRYDNIYSVHPPSRVYVFTKRVTLFPAGDTRTTGGTTSYAWFVWERDKPQYTEVKWLAPDAGQEKHGL